jgi:hypothetical protein
MRHLWSFLAGIVTAPVAWLLLATGQHRSQATFAEWAAAGAFDTAQLIGPVVFLAVAGILLGLVGTLRWSPLGPLVAGVLLISPTVFLFVSPFRTLDTISGQDGWRLLGQDFAPRLPVENGTLLVVGVLLVMATFSGQRWRRWPVAPIQPASDTRPVDGVQEPTSTPATSAMTDEQILTEARAYEQAAEEQAAGEPAAEEQPTGEPEAEEPEVGEPEAEEPEAEEPEAEEPDESGEQPHDRSGS